MERDGQAQFKNPTARFLRCVWPFWDNMHLRVK